MNARLRAVLCSLILIGGGCSSASTTESTGTVVEVGTTTTTTATSTTAPGSEPTTAAPTTIATTSTTTTESTTTANGAAAPRAATAAMVNPVVARLLVAEMEFDEGVTFCGHRLWGIEQVGAEVTTYVTGFCESLEVVAGLVELSSGSEFGVLVQMNLDGDKLAVVKAEFESENEDDPRLALPPSLERPAPNDPPYPDDPLRQAADHFGATAEAALGSQASCVELEAFGYGDYAWAVAYWVRLDRPTRLDPDGDGRPCEEAFRATEVSAYFDDPLSQFAVAASCADIRGMGFDFATAAATWVVNGAPGRMDADGNGIPCETAYPADEVAAFLEPARRFAPDLYCRDLKPEGAAFSSAVAYWMLEGAPSRMDADGNGVPCETVYVGDDLMEFLPPAFDVRAPVPAGLMCRDLHAAWGYRSALRYWLQQGSPARMDADGNGIPCETVYVPSQIDEVLFFDLVFRVP